MFGRQQLASDPVIDWDLDGNLFFGFIAFNGTKPNNGDMLVARSTKSGRRPPGYGIRTRGFVRGRERAGRERTERPAPSFGLRYGVGSAKCPPNVSELPNVAGQSVCTAGAGLGVPLTTD